MPTLMISSCNEAGGLYLFDTDTGNVEQVMEHEDSAGLAWWKYPTQVIHYSGDTLWIRDVRGKVLRQHKIGKHKEWDYHDVFVDDKYISLVSAEKNCTILFDRETFTVEEKKYIGDPEHNDMGHFNSVWADNGTLYGITFSLTPKAEAWHSEYMKGIFFQFGDRGPKPLWTGLGKPHNVRVTGKHATICNSQSGEMFLFERQGDEWRLLRKLFAGPGFIRGCAEYREGWIIGLSRVRNQRDMAYPEGKDTRKLHCSEIVYLGHEGTIFNVWPIVEIDEIYDILVLNDHYVTDDQLAAYSEGNYILRKIFTSCI